MQVTDVSESAAGIPDFAVARFSSFAISLAFSVSVTFVLMVVLHLLLSAACFSQVTVSMWHLFKLAFRLSLYLNFGLLVPLLPRESTP